MDNEMTAPPSVQRKLELPLFMTVGMVGSGLVSAIALFVMLASVFGLGTYNLGDQSVSPLQFWTSGAGVMFTVIGIWLGAIALGFRSERPWARPLAAAFWFGLALFTVPLNWIAPTDAVSFWSQLVADLAFGAIAVWYFYGKATVAAYYTALQAQSSLPTDTGPAGA